MFFFKLVLVLCMFSLRNANLIIIYDQLHFYEIEILEKVNYSLYFVNRSQFYFNFYRFDHFTSNDGKLSEIVLNLTFCERFNYLCIQSMYFNKIHY